MKNAHPTINLPCRHILLSFSVWLLPFWACAQSQPNAPAPGIRLLSGWDQSIQDGSLVVQELHSLLSGKGTPAINTAPSPGLAIYQGVTYLMPLKEAIKVLKLPNEVSSKNPVICPGFPYRTLYSYSFNYPAGGNFKEIYLVTDKADQVVAVELYAPKYSGGLYEYSRDYHVYDFINSRSKALTTARVGHDVEGGSVVKLTSAFEDPHGHVNRSTVLYLPKPLVDLILFRIQKIRAAAPSGEPQRRKS